MIPELFIRGWQRNAEWQTLAQVEQDLVISRALVDLYNEPQNFDDAYQFVVEKLISKLP